MSASREKRKRREERAAGFGVESTSKKGLTAKQKSVLTSVISIVIAIAVFVVIVANSGIIQQKAVAVSVGSEKVTAATFNYYYKDAYYNFLNTYGDIAGYFFDASLPLEDQQYSEDQTWADYFTDTAVASAEQTMILSAAAREAGFELSQESIDTIDSSLETLEANVQSVGYASVKSYLSTYYGKGCRIDSYRSYLEDNYLASEYAASITDGFTYADDQLGEFYEANKDTYDTVDFRYFTVNAETAAEDDTDFDAAAALDDAKAIADSMASQSQGNEQAFIDLARENAPEGSEELYEDDAYTLNRFKTKANVNAAYAEWLFSADRVEGETTVIENGTTGYYVVMFLSRSANDYDTVNVRHILVTPESDGEDVEPTEEQWAAAEEIANDLYTQWQDGEATEESFAELADANSDDTGSVGNGGLYEGVYMGQMVTEFNDWCFDDAREVGDTEIVKTSYGYHIMYFSGYGDQYWRSLADSGLRNEDYSAWYTETAADYNTNVKSFGMSFTSK
ncbi:MAG: hypothetical protein E7430_00965 [Ruminococcaceae bacterium]|nr:hypothetical protein [Oscillospiraceae bacterium]